MKAYCYFVEPAIYSIDLAKNIYEKNNIDYCFIKSSSYVRSDIKFKTKCLQNISTYQKLMHLFYVFRTHDFIIINGYNNYVFIITFLFNCFSFNKRYIATESDTQLNIPGNPIKRLIKWIYLSVVFRNKYVLGFAGGNFTHKELFRHYGMNEERIFLMPMMVNNTNFLQIQKKFPKTFVFLYVGRLVKHKNVEALIQQFNLHFFDQDAVLRIVGTGREESYLNKIYSSEKVLFLGKKRDKSLIKEFQNASCFLCPSLFEPWGLVVNEAMSSGLPVIATQHVGASYDLIAEKETGFIARDMNDFGFKMLTLYHNRDQLMMFSKNATNLMKESWNYNLYNNCLKIVMKKFN